MRPLGFALVLVLSLAPSASFGLEWGGTAEAGTGLAGTGAPGDPTLSGGTTLRWWVTGDVDGSVAYQLRLNVANAFQWGLGPRHPATDTLSGGIDTATIGTESLRVGRSEFRDFGGEVINTRLDGVQATVSFPWLDLRGFAGTSAFLSKGASTIVISEDDVKDRQVLEDLSHPATLWAPPRLVGAVEAAAREWLPDQTFHGQLAFQSDLRSGLPTSGDRAYTDVAKRKGAPISTAYTGLGWNGRLFGPVYGGAWAYAMGGTSLTPVGIPVTVESTDKKKDQQQYQTWRSSWLAGALGAAEVTILLPSLSYLLVDTGVEMGSWDADGASPDQNGGVTPRSPKPSLYTGWVGVSRTGSALLFNPQPANMILFHGIVSFKPAEDLQIASSNFAYVRPMPFGISEPGLKPKSSDAFLGTESDLSLLWRPASDWGGSLTWGVFLPNAGAMTRQVEAKIQASATLTF